MKILSEFGHGWLEWFHTFGFHWFVGVLTGLFIAWQWNRRSRAARSSE